MNKKQVKDFLAGLSPLDPILVEWLDAEKDSGEGWVLLADAMPIKSQFVAASTVGFYVGKTADRVRTTSDYDPSNGKVYGYDDIQLSNIRNIRRLNVLD